MIRFDRVAPLAMAAMMITAPADACDTTYITSSAQVNGFNPAHPFATNKGKSFCDPTYIWTTCIHPMTWQKIGDHYALQPTTNKIYGLNGQCK